MSYLSVSTWSLHRLLGPLHWTIWDEETRSHRTVAKEQPLELSLLELPKIASERGYKAIEVCHFHFPSTERDYLEQLRAAFEQADISLDTLLLDYGDLTAEDEGRVKEDLGLMKRWIEAASFCGAKQIRIVAGEAEPTNQAALVRSAASLLELIRFAEPLGVRVVTENFKPLTSIATNVAALYDQCEGKLGLITDFGNYKGAGKYGEIAQTAPLSVSVHAKANYDEQGIPDVEEFSQCLEAVKGTNFDGAYVLIYDGPGDMWEGLERVKELVQPYLD
ncbi:sugar phosphate isomerase/epimerase [Paenibacillus phyllosphaerae]|uniref:Sugar phosphate isomerase/epimerase n=1 Tax=Paenibacillus phyllosphaerae TaxID=274593 RepID=A0A7W5FQJ7_9BACL|nr:TIM barrel protein [Paenibacillus phyllosphaerae]MBB3113516.1 sugar phosphate isomerase/epimerase [Paenibacillus phyllosphaerae]